MHWPSDKLNVKDFTINCDKKKDVRSRIYIKYVNMKGFQK